MGEEIFATDVGYLGVGHGVEPSVGFSFGKLVDGIDHGGQHHRFAYGRIGPQGFGELGVGLDFGGNTF